MVASSSAQASLERNSSLADPVGGRIVAAGIMKAILSAGAGDVPAKPPPMIVVSLSQFSVAKKLLGVFVASLLLCPGCDSATSTAKNEILKF